MSIQRCHAIKFIILCGFPVQRHQNNVALRSSYIGAALLQNEQPVAYASRAMSYAETRYAQATAADVVEAAEMQPA